MDLKNNTILITGGAGYIGSWVSRFFLSKGYKVIVVDRLSFGSNSLLGLIGNKNFFFIKSDIREFLNYEKYLKEADTIIHLAALVGEKACKVDKNETNSINFEATKNLAKKSSEFNVKNFIFMSTASSYGVQDINEVADENTQLNPVSSYAVSKINSEKMLLNDYSEKMNITIFRPSTVHGDSARMRFDLIVNHLVLDSFKKKKISVFGPKMWRPLMWVGEPANVFYLTLKSDEKKIKSQVFNLGSNNENFQKIQIAEIIKNKFINDLTIEIVNNDPDLRSYKVNFNKIQKILNYSPEKTIDRAIGELFFSLKNNIYQDVDSSIYRN